MVRGVNVGRARLGRRPKRVARHTSARTERASWARAGPHGRVSPPAKSRWERRGRRTEGRRSPTRTSRNTASTPTRSARTLLPASETRRPTVGHSVKPSFDKSFRDGPVVIVSHRTLEILPTARLEQCRCSGEQMSLTKMSLTLCKAFIDADRHRAVESVGMQAWQGPELSGD